MNRKTHYALLNAVIFRPKPRELPPSTYRYDRTVGAWVSKEENKNIKLMVLSSDRPELSTKKADIETGEDQKGE